MTEEQRARRRDSAATREALLDAATAMFADRGFDRTTVRDIAKEAGVNQALLFRYFGSKEALFEEAIARGGHEQIATTKPELLLETVLRNLLTSETGGERNHTLRVFLRATGNNKAASAARQRLGEEYTRALSSLTDAEDADLRADLVLAWLVGISFLRDITEKDPLAGAEANRIVELVLNASRTLLERIDKP